MDWLELRGGLLSGFMYNSFPKIDTPTIDTAKIDTPNIDTPKIDTPKVDTPKILHCRKNAAIQGFQLSSTIRQYELGNMKTVQAEPLEVHF